ncbi:hypothetical protein UlMin_017732 [Ulmus minor]
MADFVFPLAQKVLEKLASFAYEEISLAWGLKEEIEKFQESMSTIKAVILDAEERQTNERAIRIWLTKLKDVLLKARDLLDEIECEVLRSQVVKAHGSVGRKLRRFFSSSNPLVFRFSIGHGIKKIRERIDEIVAEKDKFNLIVQHEEKKIKHGRREPTYSYVRASEVIGREDEKQKIVELLMQSDDERNVDVIPICGIGGLGKTTLAKMVYDDGRVKDHFNLKMWVHASKDFNVPRLIKEILDSATGKVNENLTLELMQTQLRGILRDGKFLLILDDVWNENPHKWFELRDMLMEGSKGSKIVVTTRSNKVALLVRTVPTTFNLTDLSQEDSLSLFLKWAFKEGKDKPHEKLVEIGREIVERCQGVPLAVRTLGSLLHSKVDEQDWIDVRDSEMWKLKQNEDDIFPVLQLSYNELPSYLKQCFLYCSLFPKGYKFHISDVVQFWIALGVVIQSHDENKSLEYIGEQHFRELWSSSFFQVEENLDDIEEHGLNNTFTMHDLIHDLSLSVAESECLIVNSQTKHIPKRVGHLSIIDGGEDKFLSFLSSLDKVRTIRFSIDDEVEPSRACLVDKCIMRFKYLRILDLSNSTFEMLPSSIGRAKHLRYLDLSRNMKMRKLPDSICKLQSLLTLKLEGCENLEGLPRDMKNLISLRFLSITTNETFIPEDRIACLTSLRTLIISFCKRLVTLPDGLRCLTGLEDLRIINCRKLVLNEADDVEIKRLSLQTLRLVGLDEMVALPGWLQGSADTLRYLHITGCYRLTQLPEWLTKMTSIQKIFICNCLDLESLPAEGMHRLSSLQEIRIGECKKLGKFIEEIGKDWVRKVYFDPELQRLARKFL